MTTYGADCAITQSYVVKISDWRVRISDSCNLTYITPIEFNTGSKAMKYKLSRLSTILTGLIGGVVLLASSGVYAGNEAYLYSSPSLVADEDRASGAFQYTVASYHEDGVDGAKPGAWVGNYGQLANENVALEVSVWELLPCSTHTVLFVQAVTTINPPTSRWVLLQMN
jgi:hypothetical protein